MGGICDTASNTTVQTSNSKRVENSAKSWTEDKNSRIIIIGAGPAGVHMSSLLAKKGYTNITILEKSNRIGGKSWTLTDKDGNPQEMGTCFTSPIGGFFDVIYDLFKEYFPQNKMVDLPDSDKGIFSSFNDETRGEFKEYIYAKIEDLTTPEWLHFMPDVLTGGIEFIVSANKYITKHKEIFGENYQYSVLPKPNDKNLKLISMTMMEWLKKNDLEGMIPLYLLVYSMFGYGSIKDIPAYYGLWWFKPKIVEAMVSLQNIVDPKPTAKITSLGFQKLWINMIEKHDIDVEFNCNVKSINRNLNDYGKKIVISYDQSDHDGNDGKENESKENAYEIECDALFLACGNKTALNFLNDATDQEKEIFGAIKHFTLSTAFIDFKTNDIIRKQYVADNLYPKGIFHLILFLVVYFCFSLFLFFWIILVFF